VCAVGACINAGKEGRGEVVRTGVGAACGVTWLLLRHCWRMLALTVCVHRVWDYWVQAVRRQRALAERHTQWAEQALPPSSFACISTCMGLAPASWGRHVTNNFETNSTTDDQQHYLFC
jgi:hypothetical protein